MPAPLEWVKIDPRDNVHHDQRADLLAGHWAEIGPDERGWSVTIIRAENDYCDQLAVFDATAPDEAIAKGYVEAWQATYHRHAVRIQPLRPVAHLFWRWVISCRECNLWQTRANLPSAYALAANHATEQECEHLWNERLVGVR